MIFWIWCICLVAAVVLYIRHSHTRFNRSGVKFLKPLPLVGNMGRLLLKLEHFSDSLNQIYRAFPKERFVGRFEFGFPLIIIRDLELIKKIGVKDFEHFTDHRLLMKKGSDPVFGRVLIALKGDEWKDMRSTLSPAFTSSKIRLMVPFMVEAGDQLIKSLTEKLKATNDGYLDLDVKDLTSRYATDVIASCAFGLKVDSHTEEDNQFYLKGKAAATFSFKQLLIIFGYIAIPAIMNILKVPFLSEDTRSFFRQLVLKAMQERELRHIVRPDMIHLLMEAKKGQLTHTDKGANEKDTHAGFATVEESSIGTQESNRVWTDDDLVAQAVLFFIAGFETVSSTMSFLLYELAVNPDVQDKLVREIREYDEKNGGKFDYNSVQKMEYLDMVVSELMRKWPAAIALDRMCTKEYNLGRPNDKATEDYIVRIDEGLILPVWAIHHDPEYYPNPDKFDPERFSEENKHNIQPITYMPFGVGPRNCIGSRFALCEVKVMVYQLLRSMELCPGTKTPITAKLAVDGFQLKLEGGHWIRFKIRK